MSTWVAGVRVGVCSTDVEEVAGRTDRCFGGSGAGRVAGMETPLERHLVVPSSQVSCLFGLTLLERSD